ncbi:hypothetical protein ISF6_2360 [Piscinibacter sakaiensis]|uniref:Uncharacterized protein n=1 Tax=Piscinibacter sakaiensis TaxID=1547922 RepID=A0A0K8P2X2_PISS1|nr:hypothetical protein ISF6_2360 [Piscinibacter sakaiensis]
MLQPRAHRGVLSEIGSQVQGQHGSAFRAGSLGSGRAGSDCDGRGETSIDRPAERSTAAPAARRCRPRPTGARVDGGSPRGLPRG